MGELMTSLPLADSVVKAMVVEREAEVEGELVRAGEAGTREGLDGAGEVERVVTSGVTSGDGDGSWGSKVLEAAATGRC